MYGIWFDCEQKKVFFNIKKKIMLWISHFWHCTYL